MKLKKITIKNFRGIGYAEINMQSFTTLVGPNNIGKSTILYAIQLVLDNKKPTIEDWPNQALSSENMSIICEFDKLEDWEKKKSTISKLIYGDELLVKMEAEAYLDKGTFSYDYYVYHIEKKFPWTDKNYSEFKKDSLLTSIFEKLEITKKAHFDEKKDLITKEFEEQHNEQIESDEDWHIIKFANSLQKAIPHVMYVPASFKIEDDLKTTNTSPFAYLFNNRLFPHVKTDQSFKDYIHQADLLQKKLKGKSEDGLEIDGLKTALDSVSSTLNQILDFDSQVKLSVGDLEIENLFMKAATLLIDDEIETSLQYQGSGVQRALAFAILESNAEVDSEVDGDENRTVIVLYEEPELYIHPHLMRRLKNTLQKRSEEVKWQVICSTHSPFLINVADNPESLKVIKKDTGNKRAVYEVQSDIFEIDGEYDEKSLLRAALDFHPTVSECFFAKRVIIVEGDTELAVFSQVEELAKKLNKEYKFYKDSTIVSAGGKWTIPAIAKVLTKLNIDYKIIHDMDRKKLSDDELKNISAIHPYKANKKIEDIAGKSKVYVVEDTFEHVLWNVESDKIKASDKPYNSWKRIKDYISGEIELEEKNKNKLIEIFEFAFN